MTKEEATRRTLGSITQQRGAWTILGKSRIYSGSAVSCTATGDEKTALEAWQIKFPTYIPITMTRHCEAKQRLVGKRMNGDWKFSIKEANTLRKKLGLPLLDSDGNAPLATHSQQRDAINREETLNASESPQRRRRRRRGRTSNEATEAASVEHSDDSAPKRRRRRRRRSTT